jgi:hypothetical protein
MEFGMEGGQKLVTRLEFLIFPLQEDRSPDSAVAIATDYGLDDRGVGV